LPARTRRAGLVWREPNLARPPTGRWLIFVGGRCVDHPNLEILVKRARHCASGGSIAAMISRSVSVLLVPAMLSAWLSPLSVEARTLAPPEEITEASEPPSDPVAQAQRLFDAGAVKYETADYIGAIELWTEAFGLVPSVPEYASVKARLIANIAAAQERAYSVDKQVSHLNQAKILLERYRSALPDIYVDEVEREKELAWVDERVSKIDAELKVVAEREAAAERQAAAERAAAEQAANENDDQPEPPPPGRGLVIAGSVIAGLGVGGLGVMTTGMVLGSQNDDISDLATNDLVTRADRFRMGRLGNTLAIAGGVGGAVLLGTGVALLVLGLKKNRGAGEGRADVTIVPAFDGARAGVAFVGRF
jgi:hypothetical protein